MASLTGPPKSAKSWIWVVLRAKKRSAAFIFFPIWRFISRALVDRPKGSYKWGGLSVGGRFTPKLLGGTITSLPTPRHSPPCEVRSTMAPVLWLAVPLPS